MSPRALALVVALVIALVPASQVLAAADTQADGIVGRWLTEPRDGIIEISRDAGGIYTGRIIGGDSPGRADASNSDPARRAAPLLGQVILQQLLYKGHGQWSDGTIYDPDSGRTYHCNVEMLNADQLRVRGFIGVSLLGRSQIWTRFQGSNLTLPSSRH